MVRRRSPNLGDVPALQVQRWLRPKFHLGVLPRRTSIAGAAPAFGVRDVSRLGFCGRLSGLGATSSGTALMCPLRSLL
eukprot:5764830-Prymnesium_polylepis.1